MVLRYTVVMVALVGDLAFVIVEVSASFDAACVSATALAAARCFNESPLELHSVVPLIIVPCIVQGGTSTCAPHMHLNKMFHGTTMWNGV